MSGKECVPAVVPRVTRILIFVRGVVTELKNARAMRRNLVIEGPDGAGKSTLIGQLRERYPELPEPTRAATSTGGPVPNMTGWITTDAVATMVRQGSRLYDRHPLISGPIYEPFCPQTFPTSGPWYTYHLQRMRSISFVVVCLPAQDTVVDNLAAEPQLAGVKENIRHIWRKYHQLIDMGGIVDFWYDYEESDDFDTLCYRIESEVL